MSMHMGPFIDSLIKPVYIYGIDMIQAYQRNFKSWDIPLHYLYWLSDPWIIYFVWFPFLYYNSMRMGLRVLWAATITEYVCIIFKLMVHGHRPFWWVYESPYHITSPKVAQYPMTCETTPATPSDRTMITACVTFILVQHYCRCKGLTMQCNWTHYMGIWGAHYGFQALIMIAGAFFATTFPHQAVIGTIMGSMMARRFSRTNVLEISFAGFTWMMFFMIALFSMLNGGFWVLGYDPTWAGGKASNACRTLKWMDIYRDFLVENVVRASGLVMGLGLATRFFTSNALKITDGCLPRVKLVHASVGCVIIVIFDLFIQPPFTIAPSIYYVFLFVKYTIPPILIITDIPFITGLAKIISAGLVDDDPRCFAQLGGDPMIPDNDASCAPSPLNKDECCIAPIPDRCCPGGGPCCQPSRPAQSKLLTYRTTQNQLLSTSIHEEQEVSNTLNNLNIQQNTESRFFGGSPRESQQHSEGKRSHVINSLIKVKNAQTFIDRIQSQQAGGRRMPGPRLMDLRERGNSKQFLNRNLKKPGSLQAMSTIRDKTISTKSSMRRCSNGDSPNGGSNAQQSAYLNGSHRMSKAGLKLLDGGLSNLSAANESIGRRRTRKRRPDLFRKFKASAWISIIIRRLCLANLRNSEDSESPYMRNIKFVDDMVAEKQDNLLFSVEEFKANREMRMSEISKHILIKPTWARNDQELLHVQIVLRSIKDYANYPVAIQKKIAEVGEYVKYESRRIIVREGHPAWNFYIILSGSVVVLVMDDERSFVKPKAVLRKGQSFGELAIIHGDRRRSTIVAMEETELLSLWHEDYQDIFMDGGVSKAEDEFIQQHMFLKGWPIEIADDYPSLFRYHFYKRGDIVVRDSNYSNWIIMVKSGSLNVMKRLRKVEAFEWRRAQSAKRKDRDQLKLQSLADMVVLENPHRLDPPKPPEPKQLTRKETEKIIAKKYPNRRAKQKRESSSVEVSLHNVKEIQTLGVKPRSRGRKHVTSFKQEILTASGDLDAGYTREEHEETEADLNPMFVQIQTLTRGHVFGLYDIVLGKQPSFCVVSNGAEIVMIDKNFYSENLNDDILKKIRNEAQAYPSDKELQDNLQVAVDWDAYKVQALKSAVARSPRVNR